MTPFRRLTITHAAMMGGDAAMLVALADSLFLSIDPSAARSRVLLFLVVSFAPFLVIAPLIGPVIDRAAGGRRTVIQLVAAARVGLAVLMAASLDSLRLFPLVFAALVLQKTYLVSKQALVPSVVRSEAQLVEANSKLGVISGITGFVAVIPAGLIQVSPIKGWGTLLYSGLLFTYALASATRLPPDVVAANPQQPLERVQLRSTGLQLAAVAMMMLRACVGFVFFLLAFWLRTKDAGTALFGLAVSLSAIGTMIGNTISPRVRSRVREELMLAASLGLSAAAGLLAAFLGGVGAGIMLAVVVNFAAAIGKLAFESIVQRDAPEANRGRAFAQFETRFQLCWALAGLIPVVIEIPGWAGFLVVGVVALLGMVNYLAGTRAVQLGRRPPSLPLPRPPLRRGAGRRGRARQSGSPRPHGGRPLPPPRPEGRRNNP
jgi:hypothetical protein